MLLRSNRRRSRGHLVPRDQDRQKPNTGSTNRCWASWNTAIGPTDQAGSGRQPVSLGSDATGVAGPANEAATPPPEPPPVATEPPPLVPPLVPPVTPPVPAAPVVQPCGWMIVSLFRVALAVPLSKRP